VLTDKLSATVGASIDDVTGHLIQRSRLNPKAGLIWRPTFDTIFRAVAFRTLQGPFVSKFNIRPSLEPTHVVGFNQQFFGSEGEVAWRFGVAADHRVSDSLYFGFELSRRDLEVPSAVVAPDGTPAIHTPDVRESARRAYVYWTPSTHISSSFTYEYQKFDTGGFALSDGLTRVRTHRLPVAFNYFHGSGFSAGLTTTLIDQSGEFTPMQFGPDAVSEHGADRFWVADLFLGYRLPSRRGQLSLNVLNLLDEEFLFQDTDPENPRTLSQRMVLLKMTVSY
jgi:hypothetical protein